MRDRSCRAHREFSLLFFLTLRNRERYKHRSGAPLGAPFKISCSSRTESSQKGTFVNKSELIDVIAKHADISKAAAGRALDATVDAIRGSLKKGTIVTLVGFGSFYVGKRTARAGRNPRTNEPIKIRAAKVPKFRAGKALKDALN
jgi:DNA-binding protein HU-beta